MQGITISGAGALSLLSPFSTGTATRTFTLADGPAANDLTISSTVTDGVDHSQDQTYRISGSPDSGSYRLSGGLLTGVTTPIAFNATDDEVRSAIARVLPAVLW